MTGKNHLNPARLSAFIAIVVLLGANFVAVRYSNFELAPFWGATLRFSIATVILASIMVLRKLPFPRGGELRGAVVYGVLAFGASYALLYWALVQVPSGLVAVLFSTLPLVTLLMAASIRLERLTRWNSLGGVLAVVGIFVIFSEQVRIAVPLGPVVAVAVAVIVSSLASIVIKRLGAPHPITMNAIGMGVGTAILFVSSLVAREPIRLPQLPATWLALGWLIMSAIVAFILFVWLIARWTASATNYALVLTPLVTISLGAWLIQEPVTRSFLIGSAVVLAGTFIGTRRTKSTTPDLNPSKPAD